jgi:predicted RNase H-like HicB family nuclease
MKRKFTLEYWQTEKWYVGRLKEVPGVFSQGKTLKELEANIQDAYTLMMDAEAPPGVAKTRTKQIGVAV